MHCIKTGPQRFSRFCIITQKAWLESVEADMAELEINREDVHGRKKWRKNVMKRKSNPIRKRTINR